MSGARETARDAAREAVARAMWERRRINCARHDIILLPWENENAEQRANVLAEADAAIDAFTRSMGEGWRDISECTEADGDVLVANAATGERGVSSYADTAERRGFRHRNGFPATHFRPLPAAPLPNPEADQLREALEEIERLKAALTMPDAKRRLWFLSDLLGKQGYFNRSDLCDAFDVSVPQASNDIGEWMRLHDGAAIYNTSTKRYERRALTKEPTNVK